MNNRVIFDLHDAEVNVITAMRRSVALIEYLIESRLDRRNLNAARPGQQRHEAVAFEPADHIVFSKPDTQDIGEGLERIVTFGPAIQIADALELIEGEVQQRRRRLQRPASLQPEAGQCGEAMAIGQQRQLIHACHLHTRQLSLGLARHFTQPLPFLLWREQRARGTSRFTRFA
ncbi:hypothetical protein D3C73_1170720 [compost metagenome]